MDDMPIEILDPTIEEKAQCRRDIDFYTSHLDLTELKILEQIAKQLARAYSESYREWITK